MVLLILQLYVVVDSALEYLHSFLGEQSQKVVLGNCSSASMVLLWSHPPSCHSFCSVYIYKGLLGELVRRHGLSCLQYGHFFSVDLAIVVEC